MSNAGTIGIATENSGSAYFNAESCWPLARSRSFVADTFLLLRGTSNIMNHLLPKRRSMIPRSFVIRALTHQGRRYACTNCGEQMFVQYESGLCPLCYNGRRPLRGVQAMQEVPHALALAGVLDDPRLDDLDGEFAHEPYAAPHSFAGRR
jgi:hypothetical protein